MSLPIIPWLGGKRRLASSILPLFGPHGCYVEPFCGGAAIFFMKQPSDVEVINDINGELVNLYRIVQCHLEEFVRQFKWALTSRKIFEWEQIKDPRTLTDIQRAARFYYLQRNAFGGRIDGQNFGYATTAPPRLNLLRLEEDLSAAHLRLSTAYVENLPWTDCIRRYDRPHTLFYCDPPYWQTEGYGMDFGFENYEEMASLASNIAGTLIISINDHPAIRKAFKGLPMREVSTTYLVAGSDSPKAANELIIGNWRDGWPEPRPLTQPMTLF